MSPLMITQTVRNCKKQMRDVVIALSSGRRRPVKQGTNDSFFKWTNRSFIDGDFMSILFRMIKNGVELLRIIH